MIKLISFLCMSMCACTVSSVNPEQEDIEVSDQGSDMNTSVHTSGNFNPCVNGSSIRTTMIDGQNITIEVPAYCNPYADKNPPDPAPERSRDSRINPDPNVIININANTNLRR